MVLESRYHFVYYDRVPQYDIGVLATGTYNPIRSPVGPLMVCFELA